MSRPSATQSPRASSRRCSATIASRTAGSAAAREAASETAGVRISSVTSRAVEHAPDRPPRSRARRPPRPAAPPVERGQRDAAVHRPGVQVGEAERAGDRARDGRLARSGGPVDRDHHQPAPGARGRRRSRDRRPLPPPSRRPRRPPRRRGRPPRRAAPAGDRRARRAPAAQRARAADDESVGVRLDVGAQPAQSVDDGGDPVGFLDPQLAAPRTTVSPSAKQPSSATSGSSSMASGTSSASTVVASSGPLARRCRRPAPRRRTLRAARGRRARSLPSARGCAGIRPGSS